MKKIIVLCSVIGFTFNLSNAQDVIINKLGKKTLCKIDKITETTLHYHSWENLTGPSYEISVKNVKEYILEKKIVENPVKVEPPIIQAVQEPKLTPATEIPLMRQSPSKGEFKSQSSITNQAAVKAENDSKPSIFTKSNVNNDLFQQGKNDAKIYYTGYKGAGTGTFITTFIASPVIGLVPSILCSSTPPNESHLTFPNANLMREPDYVNGYLQEAKRKKSKKVWANFAIGTGTWIGIIAILASGLKK